MTLVRDLKYKEEEYHNQNQDKEIVILSAAHALHLLAHAFCAGLCGKAPRTLIANNELGAGAGCRACAPR